MARIAGAQYGLVTRGQLREAGVSDDEIKVRVRRGSLLRVHRAVYRVGHRAPSVEATYLAAVLAGGEDAVLCGRAAAHLWGLLKGQAPTAEVLVRGNRRIEGVTTRRTRSLNAQHTTVWKAIPVTTVARTVVDLAAESGEDELARVCHEAGVRYRLTPRAVAAVLEKRPRSRGAAKLRRVLDGDVKVTLSKLERRALRLLRDRGLPLPVTNRPAGGRRVDLRWPDHKLTVELDGYRFHNSRHSWEQDRRREREARARGDDFRRFTYRDVLEEPAEMLDELNAALSAGRPHPVPPPRSGTASAAASRAAPAG